MNTASSGLVGFSAVGVATTGGVRTTTLCKPATWNLGAEMLLRNPFNCGRPQRNTSRLNNTHGAQARTICGWLWDECVRWAAASAPFAGFHGSMGRQAFSKTPSAAIEHIDATMSTSQGP